MIPLSYFLLAFLLLLGIYGLMSLLSVMQMVRYGVTGSVTYFSTALFLVVAVIVVLGAGAYLVTVDWQQPLTLFGGLSSSPYLNP
jgi:hypothetical protein